jgi:hypothetical protein
LRLDTTISAQPVHFLAIAARGLCNRFGRHQPLLEASKNAGLDLGAGDRPVVVTGGAAMMVEATIAVRQDNPVYLPPQHPQVRQAGEKSARPIGEMKTLHPSLPRIGFIRSEDRRDLLLARADCIPEFIIDDPQVRNVCPDPF